MSYLDKPLTKDGYYEHIRGKSQSYKEQTKYALDWFDKFCISKFDGKSLKVILDDSMKQKYENPQRHSTNLFSLLQDFINYLGDNNQDPSTVRVNFNLVKSFLNWYGFEIYSEFVKSRLNFPKKIEEESYPLTLDDIKKILDNASEARKALYLFLSSSGMRIQETLKLRKRDLDFSFDRIMIVIPGKYTKTRKPRRTFISKEAQKYLMPILKKINDDGFLFATNADSDKAKHTEEEYFYRLRERAGMTDRYDTGIHKITLHSFRSWFVTRCNRIDPDFGNTLAGHTKYMKKYDRLTNEEKYQLYLKAEKTLSIFERVDEDQQKRIEQLEAYVKKQIEKEKMMQEREEELQGMISEGTFFEEIDRLGKNMFKKLNVQKKSNRLDELEKLL
ncbi:hypothetical protein YTPLAS73_11180 [Nitrosarchaeum sp.]|nr:hypothetical protein YTPLAS73_11180 [Nitrosarchaeum sp.]